MTARRNRRVGIQNEIKPLEPLLWSVALKQLIRIVLLAAQRQFFFGASAVWQPDQRIGEGFAEQFVPGDAGVAAHVRSLADWQVPVVGVRQHAQSPLGITAAPKSAATDSPKWPLPHPAARGSRAAATARRVTRRNALRLRVSRR